MRTVEFEWKGRRYQGAVARGIGMESSSIWFSVDGEVWKIEDERSGARRSGSKKLLAADPAMILAPMPGKIVKIFASLGADVKAGETVIVMEAMKMEYTLKAQVDGAIESLECAVGQQVSLGAPLARLRL